jgi:hypothetical protein
LGLLLSFVLTMSPGIPACADSGAATALEPGTWGGHGAAMTMAEGGTVVEFDCAMGYIRAPITILADGRFSVPGKYVPEAGGPVRLREPQPQGSPAVFSGEVDSSELLLYVDIPDEGRIIGPFKLTRSQQATLSKCL